MSHGSCSCNLLSNLGDLALTISSSCCTSVMLCSTVRPMIDSSTMSTWRPEYQLTLLIQRCYCSPRHRTRTGWGRCCRSASPCVDIIDTALDISVSPCPPCCWSAAPPAAAARTSPPSRPRSRSGSPDQSSSCHHQK